MSKERKLKIGISLLILLSIIIGVSYAFLEAQIKGEASADIRINSYTVDVLTYNVKNDINLEITRDTLVKNGENIEKSITATASLIANNKTNSATYNYNLYFLIGKNTLEYTQGENQPELLLNVYGPDGEEVTNIPGLGNQKEINGITGFDITKKSGLITISSNDTITTTTSTEETWRFKITFVNLVNNQSGNAGKSFSASVIMQTEPLEDTTLASVCKGQEIGKCFTDNYSLDSSIIYHDGKPDNALEENYELEAGDLSYRYSGATDAVHNYVCLDSKTTGDCETDDDLYRIIGLFKNEKGQYEPKLIKHTYLTTTELGDADAHIENEDIPSAYASSNFRYYWNSSMGTNEDVNNNMWTESNLNKVNLNGYFYNYITTRTTYLQNHITEHTWITGGMATTGDAKVTYDAELGKNKIKINDEACYVIGNTSVKKDCTQKDIEYKDEIGLMYLSDFLYGTTPNNWNTDANNYGIIVSSNWISIGMTEWTISRNASYGDQVWAVGAYGSANNSLSVFDNYIVRPTFYLTSDAKLKEGNGSKEKPYRITFE